MRVNLGNGVYKNITEVSKTLNIPPHTLRFWESKFPYLKPKKVGGSRFYTTNDILLIEQIQNYLKIKGYTIKGVLNIMRNMGVDAFRKGIDEEALTRNSVSEVLHSSSLDEKALTGNPVSEVLHSISLDSETPFPLPVNTPLQKVLSNIPVQNNEYIKELQNILLRLKRIRQTLA